MIPINAVDADYMEIEILGERAIFTNSRIKRETISDGFYGYDLREEEGEVVSIERYVYVNYFGTVIVSSELDFSSVHYKIISNDDIIHTGKKCSYSDYMAEVKSRKGL